MRDGENEEYHRCVAVKCAHCEEIFSCHVLATYLPEIKVAREVMLAINQELPLIKERAGTKMMKFFNQAVLRRHHARECLIIGDMINEIPLETF